MFAKIKSFFTWRNRMEQLLLDQERFIQGQFNWFSKSLHEVNKSFGKMADVNKVLVEKQERMREFIASMETAGVQRKFGGVIDVNFDRFLNAIGPLDEAELDRVIKSRKGGKVTAITRKPVRLKRRKTK